MGFVARDRERQSSARVDRAGQYVGDRGAAFHARVPDVKHGRDRVDPGLDDHGASRHDEDDGVRLHRRHLSDQRFVVGAQPERATVAAERHAAPAFGRGRELGPNAVVRRRRHQREQRSVERTGELAFVFLRIADDHDRDIGGSRVRRPTARAGARRAARQAA